MRNTQTIHRFTPALLALLAVALAAFSPAFGEVAARPLRVATLPLNPPNIARDLAAAYVESTGQPITVVRCQEFQQLADGLQAGAFDVVLGTCPGSGAECIARGLVRADSKCPLYYHRLAMIVPPGNPKRLLSAGDLSRPDLALGVFAIHTEGDFITQLQQDATLVSRDQTLLLDLVAEGRLDAAVTWDCFFDMRPDLPTIRLPRSVAGACTVLEASSWIATKTDRPADAQKFLDFCTGSDVARDLLLSAALVLWDGSGETYQGASHEFMPVYRYVAQQIAQDYAQGRHRCLDLGCGEGQMTVEIARITDLEVTGVDIEPEVLDLASRYADECGLSDRVDWVCADVHALPFPSESFDMVVSRGSMPFWRDHAQALQEVLRVLKPGGVAFIGGGCGRLCPPEVWESVRPGGGTEKEVGEVFHFPFPMGNFDALMTRVDISDYKLITDGGHWIEFCKPSSD